MTLVHSLLFPGKETTTLSGECTFLVLCPSLFSLHSPLFSFRFSLFRFLEKQDEEIVILCPNLLCQFLSLVQQNLSVVFSFLASLWSDPFCFTSSCIERDRIEATSLIRQRNREIERNRKTENSWENFIHSLHSLLSDWLSLPLTSLSSTDILSSHQLSHTWSRLDMYSRETLLLQGCNEWCKQKQENSREKVREKVKEKLAKRSSWLKSCCLLGIFIGYALDFLFDSVTGLPFPRFSIPDSIHCLSRGSSPLVLPSAQLHLNEYSVLSWKWTSNHESKGKKSKEATETLSETLLPQHKSNVSLPSTKNRVASKWRKKRGSHRKSNGEIFQEFRWKRDNDREIEFGEKEAGRRQWWCLLFLYHPLLLSSIILFSFSLSSSSSFLPNPLSVYFFFGSSKREDDLKREEGVHVFLPQTTR